MEQLEACLDQSGPLTFSGSAIGILDGDLLEVGRVLEHSLVQDLDGIGAKMCPDERVAPGVQNLEQI